MAIRCPKHVRLPDGACCELFEQFNDDYFEGLIRIEICSYKCDDGTFYSRWRMRFCCWQFSMREHRFHPPKEIHCPPD